MKNFEDKVVLITGGTSGIGFATAELFARRGAKVIITGRDGDKGQTAVHEIGKQGFTVTFLQADLANVDAPQKIVAATIEKYGKLDCAFNNAGVEGINALLADQTLENYESIMNVNLRAVFLCMKYEIQAMLKNGGGAIVNCSSIGSNVTYPGLNLYSTAKAGVDALTRSAAVEYSSQGIRTNAVCPAAVDTPMAQRGASKIPPEVIQRMMTRYPTGRIARPSEIAQLVCWLCSEEASFVTGETIKIDGGYTCG